MGRRSPNSRRRLRRNGGGGNGSPRASRSDFGNWIVGGTSLSSSGAIGGTTTSWDFNGFPLTPASRTFLLLCELRTIAAGTVVPSIGEIEIVGVMGSVYFTPDASVPSLVGGLMSVGVGIYVAEENTAATLYSTQDPLVVADAQRDNWLFLKAMSFTFPVPASNGTVSAQMIEVPVLLPRPISIGSGEALAMVISCNLPATSVIHVNSYVRSLIRRVA